MYRGGVSRGQSRVGKLAVAAATILFVSACNSPDEAAVVTTTQPGPTTIAEPGQEPGEFCVDAARVMLDQGTASLNDFSPQYFDEVDDDLNNLLVIAPAELDVPISTLRSGFSMTAQIYGEFGFNVGASGFLEALTERIDNGAMIDASVAINTYLDERCDAADLAAGRAPGGYSFDRSDPVNGPLNVLSLSPELDPETAQCIYDAWGDISKIPPAELTPELYVFPICGTSIFQLLTGDARLTGTAETDE